MVAITPIFGWGNAVPLTTGKFSFSKLYQILWNLDFGHDDSDDNDGDDDDDDDGDDGERYYDGFIYVGTAERYYDGFIWLSFMLGRQKDIMTGLFGYRLCWDGRKILRRVHLVIVYVGTAEKYYDGFIGLSFMLGRQKDIMTGLFGYRSCWDGRKILWRVYLVYVWIAERYYDRFIL
ncbi:hypothetical protein Glove_120g177 [Diversispora epigaea]|uniref:Uncharacterized protein n=1 Tax=Diversispora epigaea TaxID=1348612 RepID=A0A397J8I1_9GLOM|nr:hypothetical protein Glove_120g177 [Diversispora epigaea]